MGSGGGIVGSAVGSAVGSGVGTGPGMVGSGVGGSGVIVDVGDGPRVAVRVVVALGVRVGVFVGVHVGVLVGVLVEVQVRGRYVVNSVGMFRRLATLDQGLILLPREVVVEDLRAKRLRQVLPGWHGKPTPVYALTETRLLPAKTQRFIEFLQQRLAQAT